MRSYEILIAYHPDIGETAVKEQLERVKQIIAGNGGEVTQAVEWGLRDLAYRIKKQRRALYVILTFNGSGATVAELERNLRISEQVLRYMTTQIDPNRPPLELHRPRREGGPDEGEDEGLESGGGREDRGREDRGREDRGREDRGREEGPRAQGSGEAEAPEPS